MIRADDTGILISGSTATILMDFIFIIRSMRATLIEDFGEEATDMIISDMGKLAYLDPDDKEAFDNVIKESKFMEWKGEHDNGK